MTNRRSGHVLLGINVLVLGYLPAAWKTPLLKKDSFIDPQYWANLGRTAERGTLGTLSGEALMNEGETISLDDYAGQKIAPQTPDELLRLIEACYYQHKRRHKGLAIRLLVRVAREFGITSRGGMDRLDDAIQHAIRTGSDQDARGVRFTRRPTALPKP